MYMIGQGGMGAGAQGGRGRQEAGAPQQCQEDMECPAQGARGLAAKATDVCLLQRTSALRKYLGAIHVYVSI